MKDLKEKCEKIRKEHEENNWGFSDVTLDTLLAYIEELEKEREKDKAQISDLLRRIFD